MKEKTAKSRYFACLVYNDRLQELAGDEEPLKWLERQLVKTFGDFLVSPLHKPDEEVESEHYHLIYRHPNTVRVDVVRDTFSDLKFVYNDFWLILHHPRNYQRYLLHLDNPEKEQFNGERDLTIVNNFPLDLSRDLSEAEKLELQMDIEEFAEEFTIYEYAVMCNYLRKNGLREHYSYFTKHTHHFGKFLDSLRFMQQRNEEADMNK